MMTVKDRFNSVMREAKHVKKIPAVMIPLNLWAVWKLIHKIIDCFDTWEEEQKQMEDFTRNDVKRTAIDTPATLDFVDCQSGMNGESGGFEKP